MGLELVYLLMLVTSVHHCFIRNYFFIFSATSEVYIHDAWFSHATEALAWGGLDICAVLFPYGKILFLLSLITSNTWL